MENLVVLLEKFGKRTIYVTSTLAQSTAIPWVQAEHC